MAGRRWFLYFSFGLLGDLVLSPALMLPRLPHPDMRPKQVISSRVPSG